MTDADPRRRIPSVDRVLASEAFATLAAAIPRERLRRAVTAVQDGVRSELEEGAPPPGFDVPEWYLPRVEAWLEIQERPSLRRVINATGVVLHTNLGRAPLPEPARAALALLSAGYSNLEFDLEEGRRGSRYSHCAALLRELTGAEAALVVNNNAAAVVLALNTLALGRDVVVSRGELVEIGGSFRVPEILERSGAHMVEVGSTNRTHPRDYEAAISERTGAVLKVHRSNFRLSGFTAEVGTAELADVAHARDVALVEDLGSGLLVDPALLGLPAEPTAAGVLQAGADVVTMSGDKLLGGPQAGIILGRAGPVERMRHNPLCRALRVDKLTLAALEATLALYRSTERALEQIPTLEMLALPLEVLLRRAESVVARLGAAGVSASIVAGTSAVGGGAYPDVGLPTALVALGAAEPAAPTLLARLRAGEPPVVARIRDDHVVLDVRTVATDEEEALVLAVSLAAKS